MIYLIRHGQTDWNLKKIIQGHCDVPLNKTGINEAKEIKKEFEKIKFDIVFSSPLKRSLDTAKIITNEKVIIDDRLKERCNGDFEGKRKTTVFKNINFNDDNDCQKYNIETLTSINQRLKSFIDYINAEHKNSNILIVTHAGTILNIRFLLEGLPKIVNDYKIDNCNYISYNNDEFKVE